MNSNFMKVCINGHKEVVKSLIDQWDSKTINLNTKDIHGRTPFMKTWTKPYKMRLFEAIFRHCVCITISWLFPIQNSLSFRDVNYSITKPTGTYLMYHDFVNSQFFLMMVLMWWRPYPLKTKLTVIVIGGVIQKVWEEHRAGWTHSPVTHV